SATRAAGAGAASAHAAAGSSECVSIRRTRGFPDLLVAHAVAAATASAHIACARTAVAHVASACTGTSSAVSHVPITRARTGAAIPHPAGGLLPGLVLPCVGLPIGHRVAPCRTTELVGRASVAVRSSAAVLGVVLPIAVAPGRLIRWTVATVSVVDVLPVAVVDEVIVVVDGDVVVAAPSGVVAPTSAPHRSHRDANTEGNGHARRVIARRGISDWGVGINGRPVHYCWVVARDIHYFWTGLLNHDHLFALDNLGFNLLLFRRFQVAGVLGFLSHALHCIHHIVLLRKK